MATSVSKSSQRRRRRRGRTSIPSSSRRRLIWKMNLILTMVKSTSFRTTSASHLIGISESKVLWDFDDSFNLYIWIQLFKFNEQIISDLFNCKWPVSVKRHIGYRVHWQFWLAVCNRPFKSYLKYLAYDHHLICLCLDYAIKNISSRFNKKYKYWFLSFYGKRSSTRSEICTVCFNRERWQWSKNWRMKRKRQEGNPSL